MPVDLTQLKPGQTGTIVEMHGGHGFMSRMENMGIRTGKKVTKISSQFMRGPQTIKIDGMQFALGYGMARKIFVEV
jgi:ferrous iron transport protein A